MEGMMGVSAHRRAQQLAAERRYRARHPERVREQNARQQAKPGSRWRDIKRYYHLSPWDYLAMMAAQGNCCARCGTMPGKWLEVDHDHRCCPGDHSCGACIRQLLCHRCNTALAREEGDLLAVG